MTIHAIFKKSLVLFLILFPFTAKCMVLEGGEITYECINNCTIRVHLKVYQKCTDTSTVSPNGFSFVPQQACALPSPIGGWQLINMAEVTIGCPLGMDTKCSNPASLIDGIREYYWTREFEICSVPNCIYDLTYSDCCRDSSISSIVGGNQALHIESPGLNTGLPICNNPPVFQAPPVFYHCYNSNISIPNAAIDPDGDSLAYSIGPCLKSAGSSIQYNPGFHVTQALGPSWNVQINAVTGGITILPQPGSNVSGVFCVYVEEWRGGNLVNTTVRDFTFYFIDCYYNPCNGNLIRGKVYADMNTNCLFDLSDISIPGQYISVNGNASMVATDQNGDFTAMVDTGNYLVQPYSPYGGASNISCPPSGNYLMNFTQWSGVVSDSNDFAIDPSGYCAELIVAVQSGSLRPCAPTKIWIEYKNMGLDTVFNATVEVVTDTSLVFNSATASLLSNVNNTLLFDLGDIPPLTTDRFEINMNVPCDASLTGQTFCTRAHIYPDTICLDADSTWDGSRVAVSAHCDGDSLVCFSLENRGTPGSGDMAGPVDWRLYEDNVLILSDSLQLCGGCDTTLCFNADGHTFRMEVDQRPGHPGNSHPNAVIEQCGNPFNSLGLVTSLPFDNLDPFVDVDCEMVVNSYDPNSKKVFPSGVDAIYHYVDSTAELTYEIDFQNTGTADAIEVMIIDTLDPGLDLSTFRAGVSSHPYYFEIVPGGVLKFYFHHIFLPPASTDSLGSIGWVRFKIKPAQGVSFGQVIENYGDIYFDLNAPIRTDTAFNTIGWPRDSIVKNDAPLTEAEFFVYPNPARERVILHYPKLAPGSEAEFKLFSIHGSLLISEKIRSNQVRSLNISGLGKGIFIYGLIENGAKIKAGKLIILNQ